MASLKFTIPLVLFTVIFCNALFCDAEANAGGNVGVTIQREFDYFVLALQWPPTCRGSNLPNFFTIHGLWPNYKPFDIRKISPLRRELDNYWPSFSCNSSSNCHGGEGLFWEHEIGALDNYCPSLSCNSSSNCHGVEGLVWEHEIGALDNYRPSLSCNSSSNYHDAEGFWRHEWKKHGTCASSVLGGQYNYFSRTLDLYHKYNITDVLQKAGYVPSNSEKYPSQGIISAIQNAFRATPRLQCLNDTVKEVHLCFTKDFKPRNCTTKTRCPKYVRLPKSVPLEPGEVKLNL